MWCDYRRGAGGPEPILPVCIFHARYLTVNIHPCNGSGEKIWSDSPLKRVCLLAKKEQLITVMVTRYSFVLDILKDPAKSFKGSSKVHRK